MADRPELPNQLDVLTERATRHLTPNEARALSEQIADLRATRDTYRSAWRSAKDRARKATAERDIARHELANQRETFTIAYDALSVRAEHADRQLAQVRALHTVEFSDEYGGRECSTCREVWPCPTVAALDGAEQPGPARDRLILDGRALPVLDHWREQGPTSDGREKWGVVTHQPAPDGEGSDR